MGACRRQAEPAPTPPPHRKEFLNGQPANRKPGPTQRPDLDRQIPEDGGELLEHLQTPAAVGGPEFGAWPVDQIAGGFGGDLDARHRHDHTRLATEFPHTHPDLQRDPVREGERAFDRLNPDYGVPADTHNPYGREAVRDREAALALGTRVTVAASRENDPNPVMWLAGQDYRAADATRTAHLQHVRQRHGPERLGAER